MSLVLTMFSEKGGVGKSTIGVAVSAYLAGKGYDVIIVDADEQRTAQEFHGIRSQREKAAPIHCVSSTGSGLPSTVRDLAGRYDVIIIDSQGRDNLTARQALTVSHCVISPFVPSAPDLLTAGTVAGAIEAARVVNPDLKAFALINRASTHVASTDHEDAAQLLDETFKGRDIVVCPNVLRDRVDWRRSFMVGSTVVENESDTKAKAEAVAAFDFILKDWI